MSVFCDAFHARKLLVFVALKMPLGSLFEGWRSSLKVTHTLATCSCILGMPQVNTSKTRTAIGS